MKIEKEKLLKVKIPVFVPDACVDLESDRKEVVRSFFTQCIVNLHYVKKEDLTMHRLVHKLQEKYPKVKDTKKLTLAFLGVMEQEKYIKVVQYKVNGHRYISLTKKLLNLKVCELAPIELFKVPTKTRIKCSRGRMKESKAIKETVDYIANHKFTINHKMLDFVNNNTPVYDNPSKNLDTVRTLRVANEVPDWFRFPHKLDSRGRDCVDMGGLSPQGCDLAKSLLLSHYKEVLTKKGYEALNETLLGYSEVPEWTESDHILHATDPLKNDSWKQADKPYSYLAGCFQLKEYLDDPKKPVSVMIPLDGKCNGLQHWSAMMKSDTIVARIGMSKDQESLDLYMYGAGEVKRVVRIKLKPHCTRKALKNPLMTVSYGATRASVHKHFVDLLGKGTEANLSASEIKELTDATMSMLKNMMPEILEGMKFFKTCAGIINKEASTAEIIWPTYDRAMARQVYDEGIQRVLTVQLPDKNTVAVTYREFLGNSPMINKSKSAIAPNIIHGMDATHLRMVASKLKELKIPCVFIHDSFSVHVNHRDTLYEIITETFIELYSRDNMKKIKVFWETYYSVELPEVPEKGNYDIESLRESTTFFS